MLRRTVAHLQKALRAGSEEGSPEVTAEVGAATAGFP